MRCMEQAFSFLWPNSRTPYLIWRNEKVIKLRVHGNIPYLVPGDPFCQPMDPSVEFPLLTVGQLHGKGDDYVAVPSRADPAGAEDEATEKGPLDDEAQIQIVPPPKPHKDAALRKVAKELAHLLTHKPANP